MKICIVSYEDPNGWILGKFARRMVEHLKEYGSDAYISRQPDPSADINHNLIYTCYEHKITSTETVMITHVDQQWKLDRIRHLLINTEMGICMSRETVEKLVQWGIPREKLCFINPAHDGVMKPRKTVIGITTRTYPGGYKRESMVAELAKSISAGDFKFVIMGSGWEEIINTLKSRDIEVEYFDDFDYERYTSLVPGLDFYLYLGQDEGSMGFIDALAAGVKTIVTPQGYHLDVPGGITYAFNEINELIDVFSRISIEKHRLSNSVAHWTWSEYSRKHMILWEFILQRKHGNISSTNQRELEQIGVVMQSASSSQHNHQIPSQAELISIFQQGVDMLKTGNSQMALKLFDEIISYNPGLPNIHYGRAAALFQLGYISEASQAAKHELSLQPDHDAARRLLEKIENQ